MYKYLTVTTEDEYGYKTITSKSGVLSRILVANKGSFVVGQPKSWPKSAGLTSEQNHETAALE